MFVAALVSAAAISLPPAMHGLVARIGGTAFPHSGVCEILGTSADSSRFYTFTPVTQSGLPPTLFVWDAATGAELARHTLGKDVGVHTGAVGPDGPWVLIQGDNRELRRVTLGSDGRLTARPLGKTFPPSDAPDGGDTRYNSSGWSVRIERNGSTFKDTNSDRQFHVAYTEPARPGVAFRPDGKMAVVVPQRGPARFYDLPAGTPAGELPPPDDEHYPSGFTPDGKGLALWSNRPDGWALELWDIAAKTKRTVVEKQENRAAVVFAPDGKSFACLLLGTWEFRDIVSGRVTARAPSGSYSPRLTPPAAFSADGKTLFVQPTWRSVVAWDTAAGRPRTPGVPGPIAPFRFTPDGHLVGFAVGSVFTWESRTGKEVARFPLPRPADHVYGFAFTPDGRRLSFVDSARALTVWDFRTGDERKFPVPAPQIPGSPFERFTPDGRLQVMADPPVIKARSVATGAVVARDLPAAWDDVGTRLYVSASAASPDGRFLALGSTSRGSGAAARVVVTMFDLTERESVRTIEVASDRVRKLAFSPDGRFLLAVGWDVMVFDAATLRKVGSVPVNRSVVLSAQFAPDGRTLAYSVGQHEVRILETGSWQVRAVLPSPRWNPEWNGSTHISEGVAFSPDGRVIATATPAGGLLVWDARELGPEPSTGLRAAWDSLVAGATPAFAAIRGFVASADAIPFLKSKLPPVPPPDAKAVARLIAALDDDDFAERERAVMELSRLGRVTEPELKSALKTAASPEVRKRLTGLLDRLSSTNLSPDELRVVRAVEAVEWIGTTDAVKLLVAWAGGAEGARLTAEAKLALARIKPR